MLNMSGVIKSDTKSIYITKPKYAQVDKTIISAYLDRINTRKYDYVIVSNDNYHIIKITLKNSIGRA